MNEPPGSRDVSPSPAWSQLRRGGQWLREPRGCRAGASQSMLLSSFGLKHFLYFGKCISDVCACCLSPAHIPKSSSPLAPLSLPLSPALQLRSSNQTRLQSDTHDYNVPRSEAASFSLHWGWRADTRVAGTGPAPRRPQEHTALSAWAEGGGVCYLYLHLLLSIKGRKGQASNPFSL